MWGTPEISLCCFLVLDVEVLELVGVLVGGDHSKELLKVLLLQVLLGEPFQVSLGEWDLGLDDEGLSLHTNGNAVAKVTLLLVNLDVASQIRLEVLEHDNVILDWELAVDVILGGGLLGSLLLSFLDGSRCLSF